MQVQELPDVKKLSYSTDFSQDGSTVTLTPQFDSGRDVYLVLFDGLVTSSPGSATVFNDRLVIGYSGSTWEPTIESDGAPTHAILKNFKVSVTK